MLTSMENHRLDYMIKQYNGLRLICMYEKIFREAHILYTNRELYFFLNEDVDGSLPIVREKYINDILKLTEYLQSKKDILFTLHPSKSRYTPTADGVFLVGNYKLPKGVSDFLEQALMCDILIKN